MLMKLKKFLSLLVVFFTFYSCLEPFDATVGNRSTSLLVVDGLISNEDVPHFVKLTRTISNIDQEIIKETGAVVAIEDDNGIQSVFTEIEDGIYQINSSEFIGVPGNTYHVNIKTKDGKQYQSDPILMKPPSEIDEVYFVPGNNSTGAKNKSLNGLGIYVSGHINTDEIEYLRWSYEEDWKFQVPFAPIEVPNPDNTWRPVDSKKYCWKSSVSSEIQLHSFRNQTNKSVLGKELYFIVADETDKLIIRYSTKIKQYSISKEEYEFWNKLEQTNPDVGNIFGVQPFTIRGNIKNVNNSDEVVLGFFQVAGCSTERMYIDFPEIQDLRLHMKDRYITCSYDSLMLDKLNEGSAPENPAFGSIYDIYDHYVLSGDLNYELAFPIFQSPLSQKVVGLALSSKQCTDCTLEGNIQPPDFWIE